MSSNNYRTLLQKHRIEGLSDCPVGGVTDLYAFIVDFKPIKKASKGRGDYSQSIAITDPTIQNRSINVQIFQSNPDMLPKVEKGRLIVLKNIYINNFNKKPQPVNRKETVYVTVEMKDFETFPSLDIECALDNTDIAILKGLRQFYNNPEEKRSATALQGKPTLRTEELDPHPAKFFDYVGMVVGYYPEKSGRFVKTNLILTDYTVNPKPYLQDEEGIRGIRSKLLLQCTLWDNHAEACPELRFGDYVGLKNCIRNKRQGILEIAIKGNNDKKRHVNKLRADDPLLATLLERKQAYKPIPIKMKESEKREADDKEIDELVLKDEGLAEQLEKERKRKELEQDDDVEQPPAQKPKYEQKEEIVFSLAKIREQTEGAYVTNVRVVDYKPKKIREWFYGFCSSCQCTFNNPHAPCQSCGAETKIIYKFGLLLKDKESLLRAYVFGDDAVKLLCGIRPEEALKEKEKLETIKDLMLQLTSEEDLYLGYKIKVYESDDGISFKIHDTDLAFA